MYLDFHGLKEKPFTLSPNPKFLYYSPKHKEALSQFIFAVYEQSGFMALTGEVGTGKTILINALVKSLPKDHVIININHKILSTKGLVQNICKELGIDFSKKTATELFITLREYLEKAHKEGKKNILILDEAQNLTQNILEDIRLLSNFEAMDKKYLQILIVGQPELDKKLEDVNLRQLKERISLRYHLKNLNRKETGKYIKHRLKVAGYDSERNLYTEDAIDYVYIQTEGIPRRINIICENALLMAYATNSQEINAAIIQKIDSTEISSEFADVDSHKNSDAESETGFNNLTENATTNLISSDDSPGTNDPGPQNQPQELASEASLETINLDINDSISQSEMDEPVDRMNLETNPTDIEASEVQTQQTPSLNEADSKGEAFDAKVPVDSHQKDELPKTVTFENEAYTARDSVLQNEQTLLGKDTAPNVGDSIPHNQQGQVKNNAPLETGDLNGDTSVSPNQNHEFEGRAAIEDQTSDVDDSLTQNQEAPVVNEQTLLPNESGVESMNQNVNTSVPENHNHESGSRSSFENQIQTGGAPEAPAQKMPQSEEPIHESESSEPNVLLSHNYESGSRTTLKNQRPDPGASAMQSHRVPSPNQTSMEKKDPESGLIVQHRRERSEKNRDFENPPSDINARHSMNRGYDLNDNTSLENNNNDINMSMPQDQFLESDNSGNFENTYPHRNDSRTKNRGSAGRNFGTTEPASENQYYKSQETPYFSDNNIHSAGSFLKTENVSIKDGQIEKLIDVILNNMVIFQKPTTSQVIIGGLVVFVLFILAFFLAFLLVGIF